MKTVKLNNGIEMPVLGLGTFLSNDPAVCEQSVVDAISLGYRLIDTAQGYGNEEHIGRAIRRSACLARNFSSRPRCGSGITGTPAPRSRSRCGKLQTDYLDLVLLHWPFGDTYAAWRALEELYAEGKIRAIGVSNYTADRLVDLVNYNKVVPAVNQVETNLVSQQTEVRTWMDKLGVQHMGYAPFGQGKINEIYADEALQYIAGRYHKTVRQVVLRFQIQSDVVVIPKTTHIERMKENLEVFDFELLDNEIEIRGLLTKDSPLSEIPRIRIWFLLPLAGNCIKVLEQESRCLKYDIGSLPYNPLLHVKTELY